MSKAISRMTEQITIPLPFDMKQELYDRCAEHDPQLMPTQVVRSAIKKWLLDDSAEERELAQQAADRALAKESAAAVGLEVHSDDA